MSWVTLPIDVDIKQLDDGDGTEATLMRHHAGWHKTCHLKFNQTKLEQLQKNLAHQLCTHVQVIAILLLKMISTSFAISQLDLNISTMHLHNNIYVIDVKVHRCAIELEDIAKQYPGDMIAVKAIYHQKCLANLYNRTK